MKKAVIYLSLVAMAMGFMAFQCASPELTGAKLYINQKQYDKAKESLLKEVEKNPKSDEGWYMLGYLYGEEGNFQKMLESFDKSLEASKKFEKEVMESKKYHWATSFNKGVSYFNNGAKATTPDSMKLFFDKAIQQFNNAILCEADSVVAYSNLTYAYLNSNRTDEAIPVLEKMTKLGKTAEGFSMLGQIYNEKGSAEMDKYQTSKTAQDSLNAVQHYNKAIQVLSEGRAKFPEDGEILLRLSNAYIGANKLEEAMTAFKAGVEKEPENKFYRYNYGVLLLNSKDFAGAEVQFQKAIELDPEYTNAVYNLSVTYVRWGSEIREKAEAEGKEDMSYQDKFKLALPLMEKYLQTKPDEPVIWDLLGKIYANLGMTDKSQEAFKRADEYRK
ncbi:MAG: tetratricopeptide repeat protein [Ignavibacteriales bacterium]|nr:tetratricopeptide repeat protein [Ignavibacteriales bacterium]